MGEGVRNLLTLFIYLARLDVHTLSPMPDGIYCSIMVDPPCVRFPNLVEGEYGLCSRVTYP